MTCHARWWGRYRRFVASRIAVRIDKRGRRLATLAWVCAVACALACGYSPARQSGLAPGGSLRVGLNLGNAVTVTRDAAGGELRGVAPELGRALASRLGVAFVPVTYPSVAALADAVGAGAWDVAFLAVDPARAVTLAFSQPYMEVDNTYLVPPGSAVRDLASVDQPGTRVAVPERSAPDLFLSRTLRHATLVRSTTGLATAVQWARAGQAHAVAADRSTLLGVAAEWPGARVLDERFMVVEHAIAIPRAREGAVGDLREFVEAAKRSGLIQQAIERSGVRGVRVAHP